MMSTAPRSREARADICRWPPRHRDHRGPSASRGSVFSLLPCPLSVSPSLLLKTVLVGTLAFAMACGRSDAPASEPAATHDAHIVARSGLAMGSELTLMAWTADEDRASGAFDKVFAEFERLDALMSVWKDGSDIVRLNAAAGEHPVAVSPDTIEVLTTARQVSDWTGGKFDVTFGALSDIW